MNEITSRFDPACQLCPRLAKHLRAVKNDHPNYHAAPVAPFGAKNARFLIVGLAPGKHGANATGRPFTGDYAGVLLYDTLYQFGFSNQPVATRADDGLVLKGARITNAVKCLPPDNKPTPKEIQTCNDYLRVELNGLPKQSVILALGNIAHRAVLRAFDYKLAAYPFGHDAAYVLPNAHVLVSSYHCSRYNTQTRRLSTDMFHQVFKRIRALLEQRGAL